MESSRAHDSSKQPSPTVQPTRIFCLYDQEDVQFYRELQKHLHPLVRQQKIVWLEISGGDVLEETVLGHLRRAHVILLLITPDFLAVDALYDAMMKALQERAQRQVLVVPILARVSAWEEHLSGNLFVLPDRDRPITHWPDRDEAYKHIYLGLLRLMPHLSQYVVPEPSLASQTGVSSSVVAATRLFQVRELEASYVPRPQVFATFKRSLLGQGGKQTTAITTALRGAGGFGKTTLALALCHDPDIRAAFPDGILWVELGEQPPRTLDLLNGLLVSLGAAGTALTLEEAQEQWRSTLANKTCLLVIDDVWQMAALKPLLESGPRCKRLVTTRNDHVLPDEAARVVVDAMSPQEAIAVLCQGLPLEIEQSSAQTALARLVKQLGYWPLLLSLAHGLLATQLRYGRSLLAALAVVEQVYHAEPSVTWQQGAVSDFHRAVEASLQASLHQFQEVVNPQYHPLERYQELAIFPEDTDIPIAGLRLFWKVTAGLESWQVDDLCMQLCSLSLIQTCDLGSEIIRLHDVLRSYLIRQAGQQLPVLHARFIDAIWHGLRLNRWADVPPQNRYLWQHLIFHLCQAGRWANIQSTLTDLSYLTRKVLYVGVSALEGDLLLVSSSQQSGAIEPMLFTSLHRTIVLISHLLRQVDTPAEVGGLLLSHLGSQPLIAAQRHVLERELPRPFLTAWRPLPDWSSALLRTLHGHSLPVHGCAISADGSFIVSASMDHTLKVWDVTTGEARHTLRGHTNGVLGCAISADGLLIVSASLDHTLKVWDVTTGEVRLSLGGHTKTVEGCAISADGSFIVSASMDHTLKVWDAATGEVRHTLQGHTNAVHGCAISANGRLIVSASFDCTLKVWDATTGEVRHTLQGHTNAVHGCAISADGRLIVSASSDGTLKVWDTATGKEQHTLRGHALWGRTTYVLGCAISADGRLIVSASSDGTLKVWDATTGEVRHTLRGHTNAVCGCAINGDGRLIVSASDDGTLKVWDAATEEQRHTLQGHTDAVNGCAVSADGRLIVSASDDGTLKVWDATTGEERHTLQGHFSAVEGCAVSADGRLIVSASSDGTLKVWDATTGEERHTLQGHLDQVRGCAMSADSSFVISACMDHTLKVWDTTTGEECLTLGGHSSSVLGCAVSADGRLIVSASDDGTLKVWNAATGEEQHTLRGHTTRVKGCAVSVDDSLIVSASWDRTLKVWDTTTGAERCTLQGHADVVQGCAISGDGRLIVSASDDGTLKVWETQSGQCLLTFPVDGTLYGCAFHPDGEHLVACGELGMFFLRLVV